MYVNDFDIGYCYYISYINKKLHKNSYTTRQVFLCKFKNKFFNFYYFIKKRKERSKTKTE